MKIIIHLNAILSFQVAKCMLADCGFEQTGFITQPDTSKSDGPSIDANGWPWRSSISISFTVGYELDVDGSGIGTSWSS